MKLIDTSALYDIIAEGKKIENFFILDLTLYEFGNALWKNRKNQKCPLILKDFRGLDLKIIRIDTKDIVGIFDIAQRNSITVYDAAYAYYAKKYGLELITADKMLQKVWEKIK